MNEGTIKTKVDEKGYGFITVEGSKDVFFHATNCNNEFENMQEGQRVRFNEVRSDKGTRAENVIIV